MAGLTPSHAAVVVPCLSGAGAQRVAEILAREFARTTAVTVVTMEPRLSRAHLRDVAAQPWSERIPPGCRHVHLPSTGSGLRRLGQVVTRFAALAHRERFDVVYSFLTWTNVVVAAARAASGTYVHIASEHAMAESLRSDGVRFRLLSTTLPVVYRRPDRIVVVSEAARRSLSDAGLLPRPERAVTIPNPVDAADVYRLSRAAPAEDPAAPGQRVVACVARLHPQKDHLTLLRAMCRLPHCFVLRIVGDGPLRSELESAVSALGLTGRVTFTGALANPYPSMRQADVVVLASREEGFGLVAVEAAVLGVPFVGSATGGLAEVCALLGHRTFPPGDPEALATAIADAASLPAPPASIADLAAHLFDPSEVAAKYLSLGADPSLRHRMQGRRRRSVADEAREVVEPT
jgi:glycosyltransferase involved in cell wall biosynthesis